VNLSVTNPAASTNTAANAFTYVSNAVSAPTNVVATAVSPVQVNVTWSAVPGADSYQVYRRSTFAGGYVAAGSPVAVASFYDTGRTPGASYLYKVQAIASGTPSPDSNIDLATTVIFTDSTLIAGTTTIKAVHLTELRTAVTAVCALANCGAFPVTDSNPAGVTIQAAHITQLRTPLDASRSTLGLSPISYANTPAFGVLVRAADFTELRNGTQ
jgi:hypothetical protein